MKVAFVCKSMPLDCSRRDDVTMILRQKNHHVFLLKQKLVTNNPVLFFLLTLN